jgi:hypothetical protein
VAKPDHNFRPNPDRGVNVFGEFSDALTATVVPKILQWRQAGTLPITVYINSPGGDTRCLDTIHNTLKTNDPDGKRSWIITVVVGMANSAAATLLALGDYVIAYPDATIHFHGVRFSQDDDITMEKAAGMAAWLQAKNDATAIRLAGAFLTRLVVLYDQLKPKFAEAKESNPECISDVECFAQCIYRKLTPAGQRVVERAVSRWRSIEQLSEAVFKKVNKLKTEDSLRIEAAILSEIVNFEIKQHKGTQWSLDSDGIAQVVEDYNILRDYHAGEYQKFVKRVIQRFAFTFLSEDERKEAQTLDAKPEADKSEWLMPKIKERIRPFVYFTVSLCRYLHERENSFTARDAYWLGAVDEVYGTKLPCLRKLFEEKEEEATPELTRSSSTEPAPRS